MPGVALPQEAETSQPWGRRAQAILWAGDTIRLVGSNADVSREAQRLGIEIEDMQGRVVLPGFVDAHTHFLHVGVKTTRPDLRGAANLHEALDRLGGFLRAHPGGQPVIAEGWDESAWPNATRPTRSDIDGVVAAAAKDDAGPLDRPVVLRRICGHVAVASSGALPAIAARWPKGTAGAVVDAASGLLEEAPSLYLNEVFPSGATELDRAVQEACAVAHGLGVTSLGDYSQAPYRAALQRAARADKLTVRVASSIYVQQLETEITAGFRSGRVESAWLHDGGVKVFLDGSLGGHTAHLREPYLDGPPRGTACTHEHPRGTLIWSDGQLDESFGAAHEAGIQIHAHAIGDGAIDQGLAAFGRLKGRLRDMRHRFEHFEIVHDDQVARTAQLSLVASSQPNFVAEWSPEGGMYQDRLGARYKLNNRFRTFKAAGIPVAFGSDGMPFGPLVGLDAAVRHPNADQRLSPEEAIWHYTWMAAWSLRWENEIGSLEGGKRADIVILEQQDLQSPPKEWQIRETITGGVSRFRSVPGP